MQKKNPVQFYLAIKSERSDNTVEYIRGITKFSKSGKRLTPVELW